MQMVRVSEAEHDSEERLRSYRQDFELLQA